jgi:hypothetical protein
VLLPSIWMGWFCKKEMVFTHENTESMQYSFKQETEFTVLNKVLDPLPSNLNDSLTQAILHLPFTCMGWLGTKVIFWPKKTLRGRHYSYHQLTQYTMLNKVLVPLASNINDM